MGITQTELYEWECDHCGQVKLAPNDKEPPSGMKKLFVVDDSGGRDEIVCSKKCLVARVYPK